MGKLVNTEEELVFPEFLSTAGYWNTPSFWQQLCEMNVNEEMIADCLSYWVQTVISQFGQTTLKAVRRALRFLQWPIE